MRPANKLSKYKRLVRKKSVFLLIFSTLFSINMVVKPCNVFSHPHIFAQARLDVLINAQENTIRSLRHVWRFDTMFSSTVLMDFDKNRDGKLDDAESEKIRNTIYESLKEYSYFQFVWLNDKNIPMKEPKNFIVTLEKNQLLILFESEPKEKLEISGKIDFQIYDPSFYIAIEFIDDSNLSINKLPKGCTKKIIRPNPDEALENQKTLKEIFFENTKSDIGKMFSTRLELKCQK